MISIVCVYNDEKLLKDYLQKSLQNQGAEYELILVDNTLGRWKSVAEALNWGGKKARGKYIMFVHQDVDLCSNSWLGEVEKILDSLSDLGIAGVAGRAKNGEQLANIEHGIPPHSPVSVYFDKPTEVQTLDECLVIIPKSVFNILQFDEKVCSDWHLYAVDYCLSAVRLGLKVYVLPMFIYHRGTAVWALSKTRFQIILSLGYLPKEYYKTLEKLLIKHKKQVKHVYTTTGDWNTFYPLIIQRIDCLARAGWKFLLRKVKLK